MRFVRVGLAALLLAGFAGSACGGDAGMADLPTSTDGLPPAPGSYTGVQYVVVLSLEGLDCPGSAEAAATHMDTVVDETDREPVPPDLSEVMFGLYDVRADGERVVAAADDSGYLALLTAYPTREFYDRVASGGDPCDPEDWARRFVGGLSEDTMHTLETGRHLQGIGDAAPDDPRGKIMWLLSWWLDALGRDDGS
jgi:hypothetical protein